jgi:hypothetical protein
MLKPQAGRDKTNDALRQPRTALFSLGWAAWFSPVALRTPRTTTSTSTIGEKVIKPM